MIGFLRLIAVLVYSIPLSLLTLLAKMTSKGPALYWSHRIGCHHKIFPCPSCEPCGSIRGVVATHLLANQARFITPVGGFLRKSSLDEIPQMWCIVRGDMRVAGPRPALFNQQNLIVMRTEKGVHVMRPGRTGMDAGQWKR